MGPSGPQESTARLVVIGNFDGVHLGHQAVLRSAAAEAAAEGLTATVLTFDPHPAVVLAGKGRPVLTVTARKKALLERSAPGLEVVVQEFTRDLAELTPERFAQEILKEKLQAKTVLVGENFRFGKGRSGDLSTLKQLGQELGFVARSEPLKGDDRGAYSSTRVRQLLQDGEVGAATSILGRPHWLSGVVEKGDQRGRTLGFPTANLGQVQEALPLDGVYAVLTYAMDGQGGEFLAPGVANLGGRPTVDRPPALEVHLLGHRSDLYDQTLGVALIERIRGVEKFSDLEALKEQIGRDVEAASQILASREAPASPWDL